MLTTTEKLVRMANQIAGYFASYPDAEAIAGIHEHIVAFWTPRMVATLRAHAKAGGADLDRLATAAMLRDPAAANPAEKAVEGPVELGAMVSDAG